MYLNLFNLKEPPFRLTPDPSFLYLSRQHSQAKAYMESTLLLSDGFVVITGDIGCGKTTLIEKFISELGDEVVTAKIYQTQITPVQFLQAILAEFGFKPFRKRKAELINMLNVFLRQQHQLERKVVLIVDEAQNLSEHVLEEIRLLSGVEAKKEKVLSIILAGQPELNDTLDAPGMEQLKQRTRLRFHLSALDEEESREYVLHRLAVAGDENSNLFADACYPLIYAYSGGIPRLINTMCDTALICAYADNEPLITEAIVLAAADELGWEDYTSRTSEKRVLSITPQRGRRTGTKLMIGANSQLMREFPLHVGRLIIGRTADNDIQINSEFVSRHHAQVITNFRESVLEDLNSTNGIFVNSQRIKRRKLQDGDVIGIGTYQLTYLRDSMRDEEMEERDDE